MKKLMSILLAIALLTMVIVPVSAEETGSITINGVGTEAEYAVYKMLKLDSYNTTLGAYSYTVEPTWLDFFALSDTLTYVSVSKSDNSDIEYVTWIGGDDAETIATFAQKALAWARENDVDPAKTSANAGEFVVTGTTGKFSDLELGYYLVDSSMGALCGLTTTNPDASINAKNGAPTIDKKVQEDSGVHNADGGWGIVNTADIGQIVDFVITINVHAGAQNYVLYDNLSESFTYTDLSSVTKVVPATNTTTDLVEGVDYVITATPDAADNDHIHSFTIEFKEDFCKELETNDKLVVAYKAMLTRKATIAGAGNINTAWLSYGTTTTTGTTHKTASGTTTTYTYGFDLVKTDSQNSKLDGAKFRIYDAASGGTEVAVVKMDDGTGNYRRARADETGVEINVADGEVRLVGFDNGTYYLEETAAPEGYNKITVRQKFIISDGNLDAVYNDGVFSSGSGVHVVNKTGSMLPETGGIGTTLFITFGGFAVMAAAVVLFARKRMEQIAE